MKRNKWKKEGLTAEEMLQALRKKEKAAFLYAEPNVPNPELTKKNLPFFTMRCGSNGIVMDNDDKSLCFPSPSALASTWNKDLAQKMGQALAKEAIQSQTDVVFAPSLGIKRNPLCGFSFNLYSEDPLLTGKMGSSFALGLQSEGVGACFTDFVCANQATSYAHMDAEVDMRALKEIYLKPFDIAIKESDPWMVMTASNKLNGVDCSSNSSLLNEILKKDMKFRGVVVSGPSACQDPILNHNDGIDLEIPCSVSRTKEILKALKSSALKDDKFEDSARRVLTLALKAKQKIKNSPYSEEEQYSILQNVAEESVVLVKNEDDALPLSSYKNTCVIGALAESFQIQGKGNNKVNPRLNNSLLREIAKACKENGDELAYAPGYSLKDDATQSEIDRLMIDAEELASKYKNVIYVCGTQPSGASTDYDRTNMRLPHGQITVFNHIHEHNKNIILVVIGGSPFELPMADDVKAVIISYFGGEMSAKALHRVLIGRVNPSGRLPESWPISYPSVPSSCFYPIYKVPAPYKESIYVGYRYYESAGIPVRYPFGYGLSYSRVVFKDVTIDKKILKEGDKTEISLKVFNMSRRLTKETVQVYISSKGGSVFKASKELKDFAKVSLTEGETKPVTFNLSFKDFAYFDIESGQWQVEEGEYDIYVGKSVEDVQLAGTIFLESGFKKTRQNGLTSYYYFTNKSLFAPSDHEFEELLGHRIKNRSLLCSETYDFESTVKDISETLAGKKIVKEMKDRIDPSLPNRHQKALLANQLEMPIRLLVNYGASEKKLLSLINRANGKYLSALFSLIGGKRK